MPFESKDKHMTGSLNGDFLTKCIRYYSTIVSLG